MSNGENQRSMQVGHAECSSARIKGWAKPANLAIAVFSLLLIWWIFGEKFGMYYAGQIKFSEVGNVFVFTGRHSGWVALICSAALVVISLYEAIGPRQVMLRADELHLITAFGQHRSFPISSIRSATGRIYKGNKVRWSIRVAGYWRNIRLWSPGWHGDRQFVEALLSARPDLTTDQTREALRKGR